MLPRVFTVLPLLLCLSASASFAEIYTWTDEQGTVHFTEERGQIPKRFRAKAGRRDFAQDSPVAESPAPEVKAPETAAPPAAANRAPENYGGRTYDEWAKELTERESALKELRTRTDAIMERLNAGKLKGEERLKLVEEHNQLAEQFKKLKAEYYGRVDAARKAGLTVNIQE